MVLQALADRSFLCSGAENFNYILRDWASQFSVGIKDGPILERDQSSKYTLVDDFVQWTYWLESPERYDIPGP